MHDSSNSAHYIYYIYIGNQGSDLILLVEMDISSPPPTLAHFILKNERLIVEIVDNLEVVDRATTTDTTVHEERLDITHTFYNKQKNS